MPRLAIMLGLIFLVAASAAAGPRRGRNADRNSPAELQSFASKSYTIYTNLTRAEARPFGAHMDAVYGEYCRRFNGFGGDTHDPMPLYLFRTQEQYLTFLASHNINATNTEGLFFVQPDIQGLATWTQGKSAAHTYSVLQHEGFHQFAFNCIGPSLPVWINEGIAQYFEDSVMVGSKMYVGFANERRITSIKTALAKKQTLTFEKLLTMTDEKWHDMVVAGGWDAGLLYDQSWSMVYFLITAEKGKYRDAFEKYLVLVSKGTESDEAFERAFGTDDTEGFRERWGEFALKLEPDPITLALTRMEFLGQGLRYLDEKKEQAPESVEELKQRLQRINFEMLRTMLGSTTRYNSREDALFTYPRPNGAAADFKLLDPERSGLPPRITAPGLKPEPTLVWKRDTRGDLVQEVVFK